MGQILVRNVDDAAIERLKKKAKKEGRSLESEVRIIIEQAAKLDMEAARELVDRLRKSLKGRKFDDSAALIREDRDR
jgi:plasmid stability protein